MTARHWIITAAFMAMLGLGMNVASAQMIRRHFFNQPMAGGPAGAGTVNLPYAFNDNAGNIWRIYNNGWLQQQGNQNLYSQGAILTVDGNQPNQATNQGRIDAKTGELILENMQNNNVTITRRILFDKDENLLRYIDVIRNTQNQDQTVAVTIQSSLNFGVNAANMVADPKKKDQNLAWVAQTGAGATVVEMYAGKGAKVAPVLNWQPGNNMVQATISLAVPAGKEVAFMHLHKIVATQEMGTQYVTALKESLLLKSVPVALRRIIVNFPNPQGWIGDVELLRGDLLDVVELRGGDQFRGTLKETSYDLQTFYGPVTLPIDNVVGIVNIGQFRPRQLIVTSDGQIFGGRLKKQTLDLLLTSGQTTQIPLAQVTRAGYRKRQGEPEEWTFERPMVVMRTGERMAIKPPTPNIDVATRYGKLSLNPQTIAMVSFQNEENGVHEITLTDGSKFAGLLGAGEFDVVLETGNQSVKVPASSIAKLQLAAKLPEIDDLTPAIHLLNDDVLVGTLGGKLNLETAFDTISVNASEIRTMTRARESAQDVTLLLWDGTSVSGQLQQGELACHLKSDVTISVPIALMDEYVQPQPQPSASMLEKIKSLVVELNADDWKQRDRAQAALIGMGPVAASQLKELRVKQPPEAQKAIDIILQKMEEQRKKEKAVPAPAAPNGNPQVIAPDN